MFVAFVWYIYICCIYVCMCMACVVCLVYVWYVCLCLVCGILCVGYVYNLHMACICVVWVTCEWCARGLCMVCVYIYSIYVCNLYSMYVVHSVCGMMGVACMVMCIGAVYCKLNVWLLLFKYLLHLFWGVGRCNIHVPWSMCGGRKTTYKSPFFLSTKWVPEIEVRLDSKFFTSWAISLAKKLDSIPLLFSWRCWLSSSCWSPYLISFAVTTISAPRGWGIHPTQAMDASYTPAWSSPQPALMVLWISLCCASDKNYISSQLGNPVPE